MFIRLRGMLLHGFKVRAVPVTYKELRSGTRIIFMYSKLFQDRVHF